jgi:hypothetical protein
MTYQQLEKIIKDILDSYNVDNSGLVAEELAWELRARGLYLDREEERELIDE